MKLKSMFALYVYNKNATGSSVNTDILHHALTGLTIRGLAYSYYVMRCNIISWTVC